MLKLENRRQLYSHKNNFAESIYKFS